MMLRVGARNCRQCSTAPPRLGEAVLRLITDQEAGLTWPSFPALASLAQQAAALGLTTDSLEAAAHSQLVIKNKKQREKYNDGFLSKSLLSNVKEAEAGPDQVLIHHTVLMSACTVHLYLHLQACTCTPKHLLLTGGCLPKLPPPRGVRGAAGGPAPAEKTGVQPGNVETGRGVGDVVWA